MMLCENSDWVVREVDFPSGVHGSVMIDSDGRANIYIRQNDPVEEKLKTLYHEFTHFALDHVGSERPVCDLEDEVESALRGA